jgi:hypothetical protein
MLLLGAEGYDLNIYQGAIGGGSTSHLVLNRHGRFVACVANGQRKPFFFSDFCPFVSSDSAAKEALSKAISVGLRAEDIDWLQKQQGSLRGVIAMAYISFSATYTSIGTMSSIKNHITGYDITNYDDM